MLSVILFAALFASSWILFRSKARKPNVSTNVLFITAHPDDELMFFGPTLLNEIRWRLQSSSNSKVHLLCLSNGNFYGDGNKRTDELDSACKFLLDYCQTGLNGHQQDDNAFVWKVINNTHLPDSPAIDWPSDLIRQIVIDYVKQNDISRVITFDQYGISGHSNHIAIYETLKNCLDSSIQLWLLESVSLFRKYLSAFDLLFTCISSLYRNNWNIYFLSLFDYLYLVQALRRHQSQMLWFRYLYSSTSRYMFINTLSKN